MDVTPQRPGLKTIYSADDPVLLAHNWSGQYCKERSTPEEIGDSVIHWVDQSIAIEYHAEPAFNGMIYVIATIS